MTSRLQVSLDATENQTTVTLVGEINEESGLEALCDELSQASVVRLVLAGVNRINSIGVREWVNFMRSLEGKKVTMEECSPAIVAQLNMISNFTGAATVTSVLAPLVCEECGTEETITVDTGRPVAVSEYESPRACPTCGAHAFELDDLPQSYFAFALRDGE